MASDPSKKSIKVAESDEFNKILLESVEADEFDTIFEEELEDDAEFDQILYEALSPTEFKAMELVIPAKPMITDSDEESDSGDSSEEESTDDDDDSSENDGDDPDINGKAANEESSAIDIISKDKCGLEESSKIIQPAEEPSATTQIPAEIKSNINSEKCHTLFHSDTPSAPCQDWKWDDKNYVQLPLSPEYSKWDLISKELANLKEKCLSEKYISSPHLIGKEIVDCIHSFRNDVSLFTDLLLLAEEDLSDYLLFSLPFIIDHALNLPTHLSGPIPLLKQGESRTLLITKQLCCSLLANCFLCTWPEPPRARLPDFNFFRLLASGSNDQMEIRKEKVKCILNYFYQMSPEYLEKNGMEESLNNIVSFERRSRSFQDMALSSKQLVSVKVEDKKKIEEMNGCLQVIFGSPYVGGGILGSEAQMEEIRLCISPELIVSRIFTESLEDNEVLVVKGTQRFASYKGYGPTFRFGKPFVEKALKGDMGQAETETVFMDALPFQYQMRSNQYHIACVNRELVKCYGGFSHRKEQAKAPVATGNWGCGDLNGDPYLKFLLQWIAASENDRDMSYHTRDEHLQREIEELVVLVEENGVGLGEMYLAVVEFDQYKVEGDTLFDFISERFSKAENEG